MIKRGVEVIEEAFFRCESLREVYIPSSVKKISYSAFSFCNPSMRIYVETDANKNYEGWLNSVSRFEVNLDYISDVFD